MVPFVTFNNRAEVGIAVIDRLHDLDFRLSSRQYSYIQTQCLKLFEQYLEGLRNTRLQGCCCP